MKNHILIISSANVFNAMIKRVLPSFFSIVVYDDVAYGINDFGLNLIDENDCIIYYKPRMEDIAKIRERHPNVKMLCYFASIDPAIGMQTALMDDNVFILELPIRGNELMHVLSSIYPDEKDRLHIPTAATSPIEPGAVYIEGKNSLGAKIREFAEAVKGDLENPIVKLAIEAIKAGEAELLEAHEELKKMVEFGDNLSKKLEKALAIIDAQEVTIKSLQGR